MQQPNRRLREIVAAAEKALAAAAAAAQQIDTQTAQMVVGELEHAADHLSDANFCLDCAESDD